MDWKTLAKHLPVSHSRRENCWKCGGKHTASITNMGNRYTVFCFRCKETESETPPPMTAAERLAIRRAAEQFEASEPALPADFTQDIPIPGLLWLSKGGLHVDDIQRHGFGWSEKLRRVIMPVYDGETLVATQARRIGEGTGPKYIGQVWSGPRPVFKADCLRLLGSGSPRDRTLVLTEDILSACRVSKVAHAWSLLGTTLMPSVLLRIAESRHVRPVVWMDPDEAGVTARRKMLRQLSAAGMEPEFIHTDRDPKHIPNNEMEGLIWAGS